MRSDSAPWCAALKEAREGGVTTCRVLDRNGGNAAGALARLLAAPLRNMFAEGAEREIDMRLARRILRRILSFDLAYQIDLLEPERARRIADDFLSFFADDARYFTNARFMGEDGDGELYLRAWYGLTPATFDTGIVAVDARRVGMLWVQDED